MAARVAAQVAAQVAARLGALVHVERGAHAVARAVAVVEAGLPQWQPGQRVQGVASGALGEDCGIQRDVALQTH